MMRSLPPYVMRYLPGLFVLLLTIFAVLPLFRPGFFPIHDDEQVGRLYEMHVAVMNGHIPPRISPDLGFGYGYPLFNFYPAFVYYVAEIFVLVGFSYIVSIKLMIALGFFLAAWCMYLFAREYLGEIGAVVAATAYTYAPYHAVDVYVRGALPEFWSFVFIPAIFWSMKKLADNGQRQYLLLLAVCICSLILTHNLVAFMSVIFIGCYGLFLLIKRKTWKVLFGQFLASGFLGLLFSAYFWIPSYFEKQYTMIELLTTELADYRQHFVYLRQLWDSPWGYGGSLYGLYDGLSFQIGKVLILGAIVALGVFIVQYVRKKNISWTIPFFFGLFVLAIFFTSFYSAPVWNSIQPLSYIQFPWRFLLFTAFAGSFLTGAVLLISVSQTKKLLLAALLLVFLIATNISYFKPAKYLTEVTDRDYVDLDVIRWRTSVMAFEYVPRGIATKRSSVGTTVIDISQKEIAQSPYSVMKGSMHVVTTMNKPQEKEFQVQAQESSLLRINTYAFPGWKVYLDGKEVSYSDANKLKLITLDVPQGEHSVRAVFTDTPMRVAGNLLSVFGWLAFFMILLQGLLKQRKQQTPKKS